MPTLSVADVLGPTGVLSQRQKGWESRPQQVVMAETVAQALADRCHAVVEAPTGVGKSFAYLVPLIQHALATGRPVVVSTGTIALQEQLVRKDIPALQEIFTDLKAVLVKGRQNYLSLRRLQHAMGGGQQAWFESSEDARALKEIADWSADTTTGDKGDLDFQPPPQVWRHVVSDRGNCLGRKCPTYDQCFFYQARREVEQAHLLIVNHHLYFSDLALRDDHAAILPAHDVVVFDEAHSLEDVATEHLGSSVSEAQVRVFLDHLWSRKGKGLLGEESYAFARQLVEEARTCSEALWRDVGLLAGSGPEDTIPLGEGSRIDDVLAPALDRLCQALDECRARARDENAAAEFRAQAEKAAGLSGTVRGILARGLPDYVYYAFVPRGRGTPSLVANPLSVATLLKERLFDETPTVILTSATLAADDSERFLFLRKRLGIEGGLAKRLDSPFDYKAQVRLLLNRSPLDPNSPRFETALARWLNDYLTTAVGGTFILFTSYRQLDAVHHLMRPELDRRNRFVLRQGDQLGRSQMIDLFKRMGNAVLFGTASFWEGVDVQGEALSNVIITKLPFEVPNHPVVEARHRDITQRGGNPFLERTVPEAILRLKQGFGRLIRRHSDSGTVVICDHRVLTKAYGRYFLRALPDCETQAFQLADWA